MKIALYKQDGSRSGDVEVSERIFGAEPNENLVHRILLLQQANRRRPIAHTLTKGEVRGGGKKPHKQKHTGWARQGSSRSPHFRGGGVTFGPRSVRNFTLRASKGERRGALFSALSMKCKEGRISALEKFETASPKTKIFTTMLSALPFAKKTLFVLPEKNEVFAKSARNIPRVKTIIVNVLNVEDILTHQDVVFMQDALLKLEEVFAK